MSNLALKSYFEVSIKTGRVVGIASNTQLHGTMLSLASRGNKPEDIVITYKYSMVTQELKEVYAKNNFEFPDCLRVVEDEFK